MPFGNKNGIASTKRPPNRRESCLTPAIFGVKQCEFRKWQPRAGINGIELTNVAEEWMRSSTAIPSPY